MAKLEDGIWKLHRSTKLLLSQRAFKKIIKQILADFKDVTGKLSNRLALNAVEGLQSASEDFLTHLFMDSSTQWNTQSAEL